MLAIRPRAIALGIVALVVVLDQATKAMATLLVGPTSERSRIDLVGEWLAVEYAENRGIAFGMFAGIGPIILLAAGVVLAALVIHYFRQPDPPISESVAIGLIVGGAIGNLLDRIRLGYVVDFVAAGAWPNFNVADSAICVGVGLLLWTWFFGEEGRSATRVQEHAS